MADFHGYQTITNTTGTNVLLITGGIFRGNKDSIGSNIK